MCALETIRARLASEEGFGLVEVLAAAVIVAGGLIATLGALDSASRATSGAQLHEQAISLAQREVERLEAHPFARLELDVAPAAATDPDPNNPADPRAYVEANDFLILKSYHNRAAGPPAGSADREPLIIDPDADPTADGVSISPVSTGVPIGPPPAGGPQTTATVYRFVTRREESCTLLGTGVDLCPAEQGSRRITVAVRVDPATNGVGPRKPVYVSSVVTDPAAAPLDL